MVDLPQFAAEPVRFGEKLAASQAFSVLFREGMALVEQTASYLDGEGRREAKLLPRQAALTYATESMRLTTRLMQIASWLLLHRAVNEGEMTLTQARSENAKVKVGSTRIGADEMIHLLPARLQDLIDRSIRIQARVQRLDATIHAGTAETNGPNPVGHQLGILKAAFGR
jgi:regulator of CtrA degradation